MDSHSQLFVGLSDETMPSGLHERIMHKVMARHYAKLSFPFFLLFLGSTILSGWRVWTKLAEADFLSIVRALDESFEWSFSFASDSAATVFSVLPLYSLAMFCINVAIVLYLIAIVRHWSKISPTSIV